MLEELRAYCPNSALAIDLLQGKWKLQILCVMRSGPVRLGQLGRVIPDASKKVLTENLRKLETAGLVVRRDLGGQVRHVEYDLAEPMRKVTNDILDHMARWGELYRARVLARGEHSRVAQKSAADSPTLFDCERKGR